jgi:hypothetical protein
MPRAPDNLATIEYHPEFASDLSSALAWLDEKDPTLGDALLAELEKALLRIRRCPQAFHYSYAGARGCLVARFRYFIHFDYDPDRHVVTVLVLSHTSRKPAYWAQRLKQP